MALGAARPSRLFSPNRGYLPSHAGRSHLATFDHFLITAVFIVRAWPSLLASAVNVALPLP